MTLRQISLTTKVVSFILGGIVGIILFHLAESGHVSWWFVILNFIWAVSVGMIGVNIGRGI